MLSVEENDENTLAIEDGNESTLTIENGDELANDSNDVLS